MLTADRLRDVLDYDPNTGEFRWRVSLSSRAVAGSIAGNVHRKHKRQRPYRTIRVDGRKYAAHRLAWLYTTGAFPDGHIDHKNLDGCDNSWANLREATNQQNMFNTPLRADNTSGFKGACWSKKYKHWVAHIRVDARLRYLGAFASAKEAHEAYLAAARAVAGEFARAA